MAGPVYVAAPIRPKWNNKNTRETAHRCPSDCFECDKYGSEVSEKWNDLMPVLIEMRRTVNHFSPLIFVFFPIEFRRLRICFRFYRNRSQRATKWRRQLKPKDPIYLICVSFETQNRAHALNSLAASSLSIQPKLTFHKKTDKHIFGTSDPQRSPDKYSGFVLK